MPYKYNPFIGELDWTSSPGGGTPSIDFATDSGNATPTGAGVITIAGGTSINTSGAGSTVTITFDQIIPNTNGIDYNPGSDIDCDIITVGVTGSPTLSWDESANGFRINGSSGLIVGAEGDLEHTINGITVNSELEIHASDTQNLGGLSLHRHTNTAQYGGHIVNLRANGTFASPVIVTDGDTIARYLAAGYDGTDYALCAEMRIEIDGTPGANDMPGRFIWETSADGTQVPIEGMRLDSSQNLTLANALTVPNGGTGKTTLTPVNSLLIANATLGVATTNAGTDGQLVIGRTLGAPAFASLTSTGGTVTFTPGANTLNLETSASVPTQFDTDSGSAIPALGILQVTGSHGINTDGATNVVDIQIDNSITLGDLSAIAGGSDAITCTTGDITLASGNIEIPATTSSTVGSIVQNAKRVLHAYPDFRNIFVGAEAGNYSVSGTSCVGIGDRALTVLTSGVSNIAIGAVTGFSLQTGATNTAVGTAALQSCVSGSSNVAIGYEALKANTSGLNTAVGTYALVADVSNFGSTAVGYLSLGACTGDGNTAVGFQTGRYITSGIRNTFIGYSAGETATFTTGSYNTCVGYGAGFNLDTSDSDNINIGNRGVAADNNTIRIGNQGSGADQQDTCFIAGIAGSTVSNAVPVVLDSTTGQLGVGSNSSITNWVDVTGTSDAMEVGTGYVANNASLVTLTLPSSSIIGDTFKVITKGAGFVKIAQNASQTIQIAGSTTTSGTGGSLTATAIGDTLEIVSTADDEFYVTSSIGSWTVV